MFSSIVDQPMRLGQKKLVAVRIEFRGTCERERSSIRRNALSKNGLAPLTVPRRLPVPNIQNQNAFRLERAPERGKYRQACIVIHEVVEHAAAKNAFVPRRR